MKSVAAGNRIVVVAPARRARPVLSQLRDLGHQVSLVDDVEEAGALLASGHFDHVLLSAEDTAALIERRTEGQFADTEAWRRSISAIAHDIRSLLLALRGTLEDWAGGRTSRPPAADAKDITHGIAKLSAFLLELIAELDDIEMHVEDGAVDVEDVVETSAIAVYPTATERRQRLHIDIEESARLVRGDKTRLKRLLTNLLQFASRHAPPRGTVSVGAKGEGEEFVLAVAFDGDGMSDAQLRRMFRPVEPGKDVARGALFRAQRIAEEMAGRLWIESQKGMGTTVYVSLVHTNGQDVAEAAGQPVL